jgi:hypothetical protein
MTTLTPLALVLTTLLAQGPSATTAVDDLSTVKDLYASASFEEALTRLANVQNRLSPEQTEQYRALCLLGLGRSDEAEQSSRCSGSWKRTRCTRFRNPRSRRGS